MMKHSGIALMICAGLLAGCGNERGVVQNREALLDVSTSIKGALSAKLSGKPAAAPTAPADPLQAVAQVMASVPDVPLTLALMERSGAFSVMGVYGINGENVTWAAPTKQTLTLRNGVLVATRGIGNDLMSLEEGDLAALLRKHRVGQVTKTYRFLDGEDRTPRLSLTCKVEVQGKEVVSSGEIKAHTTIMRETCETGGTPITNVYWVDGKGRIIQSFQWAGSGVGNVVLRQLRF